MTAKKEKEYKAAKKRRMQKIKHMTFKEHERWMKQRRKAGKEYEV